MNGHSKNVLKANCVPALIHQVITTKISGRTDLLEQINPGCTSEVMVLSPALLSALIYQTRRLRYIHKLHLAF